MEKQLLVDRALVERASRAHVASDVERRAVASEFEKVLRSAAGAAEKAEKTAAKAEPAKAKADPERG